MSKTWLPPRDSPRDDLIRATHICWTRYPECVDRGNLVMGEPMARNYIDKLLLDTWFMDGIARSQEYDDSEIFRR